MESKRDMSVLPGVLELVKSRDAVCMPNMPLDPTAETAAGQRQRKAIRPNVGTA
jgi:hypothetical protein